MLLRSAFLLLVLLASLRTPARGQILWERGTGTAGQDETAVACVAVPGGVLTVGQGGGNSTGGGGQPNQLYLARLSREGTVLWQRGVSLAARNVGIVYPQGVAADAVGQVYVGSACFPLTAPVGGNISFGLLVKLSASGDTLWTRKIVGQTNAYFGQVVATADGGVVVIGSNDSDQFVAKFSAGGQELWHRSYFYSAQRVGYFNNLALLPSGGFLAVMSPNGLAPSFKYFLLDEQGQQVSEKPGRYYSHYSLTALPNGQVLASAGRLYRLSGSGDTLFSRNYQQFGRAVEVRRAVPLPDGSGRCLLAGTRRNFLDEDVSLLLVDAAGTVLRDTLLLHYGSNEYPADLHFDAQGNYLVAAYTDAGGPIGKADQLTFALRKWDRYLSTKAAGAALAGYGVYPNPVAAGQPVQVGPPPGTACAGAYELRDAWGRVVDNGPALPAGGLPTQGLPPGLYLLRLRRPANPDDWLPALRVQVQ